MPKQPTPTGTPEAETLNTVQAAALLGISRTQFWKLRKKFNWPQPVPMSTPTRLQFRRADVLALIDRDNSGQWQMNEQGQPLYGLDLETGQWHTDTPIPAKKEQE